MTLQRHADFPLFIWVNSIEERIIAYTASQQIGNVGTVFAPVGDARFALSGVTDYEEVLLIVDEWYRAHCPVVQVKELMRLQDGLDVDTLYNEPARGDRHFNRLMNMRSHVTYSEPDVKYGKEGQGLDQPIKAFFGLQELRNHRYYPNIGDVVLWMGRVYQMVKVYVSPNETWQATGLPIHVTCEAEIFRHGDSSVPYKLKDEGLMGKHRIDPSEILANT